MERLSANWKWILTTALPIVFAILVFLPDHPRVRAASGDGLDDYVVPVSYDWPHQAKPSPFPAAPVKRHRAVQPAAAQMAPVAPAPPADTSAQQ